MNNFFAPGSAAERYAKGRPYFHPLVISRIKELLPDGSTPFARALDVCCGTGMSSVALKALARSVAGADASREMLGRAPTDAGVSFCAARGESLPFGDATFDLLTVCQGFHWLERETFMGEARRVLRAGGWLAVYDNYFKGEMRENPDFKRWHAELFLAKYPSPPRVMPSFEQDEAGRFGFTILREEWIQNEMRLSAASVVDFLMTLSNTIAVVEGGRETEDEARAWLLSGVAPAFGASAEATFLFRAPLWLMRRDA